MYIISNVIEEKHERLQNTEIQNLKTNSEVNDKFLWKNKGENSIFFISLKHYLKTTNRKLRFEDNSQSYDNKKNSVKMIEEENSNNDKKEIIINTTTNYNKYDNANTNSNILFHLSIPINNYISNFTKTDKCDEIYHEYINIKYNEMQNPEKIKNNIFLFECLILLPLYQKIILSSQKKKIVFNYAFAKYRNILTNLISKETNISFKIEPFGSFSNNFLLDAGDIDICIIPDCEDYLKGFEAIINKVNDYLIKNDIAESEAVISNSRYLLLKIVDKETKFHLDITVHSILPLLNTKLIKLYSLFDQRFHIMGIYLKYWSKLNQVQGTTNFYLSSYAIIIMLIYFLQNIPEPKVLPNLQKINYKEIIYEYKYIGRVMKVNIYFEDDLLKARAHLFSINNNMTNTESVTSLLVKFFEFFSYYFDSNLMKISISNHIDDTIKEIKDNYSFSIEDPFDANHNPGKSMFYNSLSHDAFIKAMKNEINYILGGEYIRRLEKSKIKEEPN